MRWNHNADSFHVINKLMEKVATFDFNLKTNIHFMSRHCWHFNILTFNMTFWFLLKNAHIISLSMDMAMKKNTISLFSDYFPISSTLSFTFLQHFSIHSIFFWLKNKKKWPSLFELFVPVFFCNFFAEWLNFPYN